MWSPVRTLLVLAIADLLLNISARPFPNITASKNLTKRLEIQDDNTGGGGGGDGSDGGGWGDFGGDFAGDDSFGDSTGGGDTSPIEIPTVEIIGHRDDTSNAGPLPSGIDPNLVATNEDRGLSWGCALQSAVGGWQAGLACSLLEDKYKNGEGAPPKQPDPPKIPAAPSSPPSPPPLPPKAPAPAPLPKKNDSPGWRGVGPPRAIPRIINFNLSK
ncbi:MAG: hypothetical protein Q9172_003527 [Xanthocarpia lactea]